jgi:hypothetical protein
MKKTITVCNRCNQETNKFISLDVLLGSYHKTITQQTVSELEVREQIDICDKCSMIILQEILKEHIREKELVLYLDSFKVTFPKRKTEKHFIPLTGKRPVVNILPQGEENEDSKTKSND